VKIYVKEWKMGDLSDFERGQINVAHLAGASVTKTAKLLGVSRATVSKVIMAYTNHGKTTSLKRNSGQNSTLTERMLKFNIIERKRLLYIEKDCFEKSQNYCSTSDSRAEYSS
jgi:predicted transcriptional regulator